MRAAGESQGLRALCSLKCGIITGAEGDTGWLGDQSLPWNLYLARVVVSGVMEAPAGEHFLVLSLLIS